MASPKLRFKEFEADWFILPLKKLCKINQGLQIAIEDRFLENGENRFFYITNEFLRESAKKNYFIENPPISVRCKSDDILMTRTGNTGQVVTNVEGAFHNNFFKIDFDRRQVDKNFFVEFLRKNTTQHLILKYAGASTIPDLNHSDFYRIQMPITSIDEQTQIASFLSAVDEKINLLTQKYELLSQYKQGMMQKLFSQQIRFKADDGSEFGDWSQRELKEVAQINPKTKTLPKNFIYIDLESVEKGQLLLEKNITLSEAPSRAQRLLAKGDVLFQMVRPYQQNNYYFNLDGGYVASTGYAQIRTELNSKFIYYALHGKVFLDEVLNHCTGTSYPAINSSDLSSIEIEIPCLEEQTKIANFLTVIDQKIAGVAQKIEQAKQWKKGLLQQMFV